MASRTRTHLVCQLLALCWPAAVRAEAPRESEAAHGDYMGAFWGFELRGGILLRAADEPLGVIPSLGLGIRAATLVSLIDFELGVETAAMTRVGYELRRTSILGELRLHPLFIRHLRGGFESLVLASIHVALGFGAELMSTDGPAEDATHVAPGLRWGVGIEAPLGNPRAGSPSLWVGLNYRMTVTGFGDAPPGTRDMDQHAVWLSLSLRFHDIDFMRLPRPPELRDDD